MYGEYGRFRYDERPFEFRFPKQGGGGVRASKKGLCSGAMLRAFHKPDISCDVCRRAAVFHQAVYTEG